jgi:hypothetical protein
MARPKNPFLYPFKPHQTIQVAVDRVEGDPLQGFYEGEYTSERALTEVEAQLVALRVAKVLKRFGVTEIHLALEREPENATLTTMPDMR